jgi:predicted esterase
MAKALLSNTDPEIRGKSDTLVVILHGLGIGRNLNDCCDAVREFLPNADLLVPHYSSSLLSNVNPRRVADQLVEYIHEVDTDRLKRLDGGKYRSIILIGYSAGSLIIRKTYLIAMGYNDDEKIRNNFKPFPWVAKVERILLMAGLNRGISNTKPEHMSWLTYAILRLGWVVLPLLNTGKFVSHLRQGSPFVANLRVQWIRLGQSPSIQLPTTIQLLGDIDEVVAEADNIDVLADAGFKYLKIRDTGHNSIFDFKDSASGHNRKIKFHHALTTPIESLDNDSISYKDEVGQAKDHVVFVMHGIRDMGLWTSGIGKVLESVAQQLGQSVKPIRDGYGYFPMLRFLFFGSRQVNVRWFMDRYTEEIARYPHAKISFIGHSNGTYLLASALKQYHACKMHHVAFAGSVVPKNYPWDELIQTGRVEAIRNDTASADWVVGIFPGFFELLKLSDVGTAGHNGFQDDAPKDSSFDQYFKGDHGAAIQPQNHNSLAHFILSGERVAPEEGLLVKHQNSLVVLLAKLCWLVWLLIFVILVSLGFLFAWLLSLLGIPLLLTLVIYIGFVLLLLYTL